MFSEHTWYIRLLVLYNKMPHTGWLEQKTFIFHSSGGRKSKFKMPADSCWDLSSWLTDSHLVTVSSCGWERAICLLYLHDLIYPNYQQHHPQISSHQEFRLQHKNFGKTQFSPQHLSLFQKPHLKCLKIYISFPTLPFWEQWVKGRDSTF